MLGPIIPCDAPDGGHGKPKHQRVWVISSEGGNHLLSLDVRIPECPLSTPPLPFLAPATVSPATTLDICLCIAHCTFQGEAGLLASGPYLKLHVSVALQLCPYILISVPAKDIMAAEGSKVRDEWSWIVGVNASPPFPVAESKTRHS